MIKLVIEIDKKKDGHAVTVTEIAGAIQCRACKYDDKGEVLEWLTRAIAAKFER